MSSKLAKFTNHNEMYLVLDDMRRHRGDMDYKHPKGCKLYFTKPTFFTTSCS